MRPIQQSINLASFIRDPYPALALLRRDASIAYVPELSAILMSKRDDIFICEKNIAVFSSDQPDGLMTQLMGQNMMRKDGADHQRERHAIFPTVSPKLSVMCGRPSLCAKPTIFWTASQGKPTLMWSMILPCPFRQRR